MTVVRSSGRAGRGAGRVAGDMSADLAGRCAVITGAGGGLGRAFALGFAAAAVYAGLERRPFDEIEVAEWDRVMAVNLRGPWLCAKACASALRAAGGAIVNVASATVLSGSPLWAHYVASKEGLIALSRVMARELGDHGVRVNALAPGFTLTEASRELIDDAETYGVGRGAIKRGLRPDDIVGAALFLASDASAMVTGQTIVVDGGRQFL
jgi:NAD(P)-dependent dehydrogenase (short-subunit alcohol dehydrogenase family)